MSPVHRRKQQQCAGYCSGHQSGTHTSWPVHPAGEAAYPGLRGHTLVHGKPATQWPAWRLRLQRCGASVPSPGLLPKGCGPCSEPTLGQKSRSLPATTPPPGRSHCRTPAPAPMSTLRWCPQPTAARQRLATRNLPVLPSPTLDLGRGAERARGAGTREQGAGCTVPCSPPSFSRTNERV